MVDSYFKLLFMQYEFMCFFYSIMINFMNRDLPFFFFFFEVPKYSLSAMWSKGHYIISFPNLKHDSNLSFPPNFVALIFIILTFKIYSGVFFHHQSYKMCFGPDTSRDWVHFFSSSVRFLLCSNLSECPKDTFLKDVSSSSTPLPFIPLPLPHTHSSF